MNERKALFLIIDQYKLNYLKTLSIFELDERFLKQFFLIVQKEIFHSRKIMKED